MFCSCPILAVQDFPLGYGSNTTMDNVEEEENRDAPYESSCIVLLNH